MKTEQQTVASDAHWTVRYAKERPYFAVLKQFVDRHKFGRALDGKPYHTNPWKNPFPFWFPHARRRSADKYGHEDCLRHLRGEEALFVVNTPRVRVHEIVFDIDDVDADKPCDGFAVAEVIRQVLIPVAAEVFVEPSRHRRGAYLRMLIRRDATPRDFNRLLMDICRSLRERHNPSFIERYNARICGIKGTIWYRFENPQFDPVHYADRGKTYEYLKTTYVGKFEPVLALERYRYSRGVLVTAACFGCYKDAPERCQGYVDWAKWKRGKRVISEEYLRRWLTANPIPSRDGGNVEGEERGEGEINSICQMHQSGGGVEGVRGNEALDLVPLQASPDAWKRSVVCYKRLCRYLNRPASYEELWAAYHDQGLNTGDDVDGRRKVRLGRVTDIYSVTFDEAKSIGGGFHRRGHALLWMVRGRVRPDHREGVKYKGGIEDVDLAVALYVVEVNAFKLRRDPDQQYTCGNEAFEGMFDALNKAKEIDRACGREKAGALKRILANAQLIQCLDPKWVPKSLSLRGKGTSKKYGLGERHPRYGEFQFVLKNQPVVRVGMSAVRVGHPEDLVW